VIHVQKVNYVHCSVKGAELLAALGCALTTSPATDDAFWKGLGFAFNDQFTDDKAACLVIGDGAYAMLLTEPFFKTFTKKEVCDATTHVEGLFAFSCASRAEVDATVDKALASGGGDPGKAQDHGFMYQRSFYDPDHHHWEVLWMDPSHVQ
jgi:uncharacterized protein